MILIKLAKAIVVRLALTLHCIITVWRVTVDLQDEIYWLMALIMVPFLVEAAYTLVKRGGEDFRRFTPCFFFYLLTAIPCVWLLELKKSDSFLNSEQDRPVVNESISQNAIGPVEIDFGIDINPGTWTVLIEELLLYLLIVSRWLLPRGQVSREQLSELLFAFIGIASDIMEMFSLFGLEDVRKNRTLSYFVLGCWSLSILQFCMTVTVIHEPRKAKVIKVIDDNNYEKERPMIWYQIAAIWVSMLMQDIPFLILRLYTIITYNIINYSLIFFTSKNILVISLLMYKIAVLLQKRYCPEFLDDDEDDEEKQIYGNESHGKRGPTGFHQMSEHDSDSSGEKHKIERFYDRDGPAKTNESFQGDKGKGLDSSDAPQPPGTPRSPVKAPAAANQPNESTPLRQRKGDINPADTPKSSRPASSIQGSTSPQQQGGASGTPSTVSTQVEAESKPQKPVASGFGWVSSKPQN